MKLHHLVAVVSVFSLSAWLSPPAMALTRTVSEKEYGVKATLSLTYSTLKCSNITTYKPTKGTIKFTRTKAKRKVYVKGGNLIGMSVGVICGGNGKIWEVPPGKIKTGKVLDAKKTYSQTRKISGAPYVGQPFVFNNWVRYQVHEVFPGRVYTHDYCLDNVVRGDGVC